MKRYEGIFLLKPDLTSDVLDKVLHQVQDIIGKNNGSMDEIKDWGKQRLAYPIRKYKEGIYYLMNFSIDPNAISKIKQSFRINESILRVLIVSNK
ncbi:MAG: 30S ribosomal protein S6 [Candidatus Omnitrophica bacterium]|nr:30S ribosomal protein S6 [Candidatus Omnitrophota bacterium]MBU1853644.1 30S ribosomal protein S6 [Candidatus Omnitrophota bacterium]